MQRHAGEACRRCARGFAEEIDKDAFFRHGVLIRENADGSPPFKILSITRADSFLKMGSLPEAQRYLLTERVEALIIERASA